MISFKAIVFNQYRTNRWGGGEGSKLHLPWPKHFWNCLLREKCLTDGVSSAEALRAERSFLLFCQMFPLSVPSIKSWLIFLPLTSVWLFKKIMLLVFLYDFMFLLGTSMWSVTLYNVELVVEASKVTTAAHRIWGAVLRRKWVKSLNSMCRLAHKSL